MFQLVFCLMMTMTSPQNWIVPRRAAEKIDAPTCNGHGQKLLNTKLTEKSEQRD